MHFSLAPVVMVLLVSVLAVIVCRRLRIPSMLGYLLVGFIAGPGLLHLIPESPSTDYLGEIGIVFLTFSIGLEFSLGKLKSMRTLLIGLGGMQVVFTMLLLMGILMLVGTPALWSFSVAGALVMSSTAIVSRLLSERTELSQTHGNMAMGVLLMQDIAVVPLMILLPALAGPNDHLWLDLLLAFINMALTLSLLLFVGHKLMAPWFRLVAKSGSSELFMINVLLVTLGIAYLTEMAGLSLALGAFVAGMLIAETDYRFQVEADIRPFRDILLGFFFITVGMKLNIAVLLQSWQLVLLLLSMLILLKALVVFAISRCMRHKPMDSLRTALYLAQGSEFGFVLLAVSGHFHLLSPELEQSTIAAILISMIVAPLLINSSDTIVRFFFRSAWDQESVNLHALMVETMALDGHSLIIGFGARGQSISRILTEENKSYHALDLDVERVMNARLAGESVSFGDAKRTEVLLAAGLERAKMVIITLSNMHESEQILNTIMLLDPTKSVVVRVTDDDYINVFAHMGADDVVSDSKESSLALAAEAMLALGMNYRQVHHIVSKVRRDHYQVLAGVFKGHDDAIDLEGESSQIVRYAFMLPPESKAVGMTVAELPLDKEKVSLISIRRHAFQIRNPINEFVLEADDTLVLVGAKGWVNAFESWALMGD